MKTNELIKMKRKEKSSGGFPKFITKHIKKHPANALNKRSTGCYHCRQRGSNPHITLVNS